jgi:hypothetical protein
MKPTQVDLIRCVEASLAEHIAPNVRGAMAQSQLLTIQYLLDQVRLRVEHEPEALASFELDARQTLRHIDDLGVDALSDLTLRIRDVLAAEVPVGAAGLTLAALDDRTAQLRECLDQAVRALGEADPTDRPAAQALELARECVARQLDREAAWLRTGYARPRR